MLVVFGASPALAHHYEIEVDAPSGSVVIGEDINLGVHVFDENSGAAAEGVAVIVYATIEFAGTTAEYPMMRGVTDGSGQIEFVHSWSQVGPHSLRVEVVGGNDAHSESVDLMVGNGSQLRRTQPILDLPGPGGVSILFVVGGAWLILAFVVWLIVRSSVAEDLPGRDPGEGWFGRKGISVATLLLAFTIVTGAVLVIVLARTPNSHANVDPIGYNRTPVALLSDRVDFAGPGLAASVTGDASTGACSTALATGVYAAEDSGPCEDGRILFAVYGCAGCHGVDGRGGAVARGLTSVARDWLGQAVEAGLGSEMPAFGSRVSVTDLDAIFVFLQLSGQANGGDAAGPAVSIGNPFTTPPSTIPSVTVAGQFGDVAAILNANCAVCHSGAGDGGYSIDDYDKVIAGGNSGPAVIPGDADASHLAQRLLGTSGLRMPPGSALSEADIAVIVDWINGGAVGPETSVGETGKPILFADVSAIFERSCTACHGAAGGYSLESYDGAINGGTSGIAVIAGDPDGSLLLQRIKGTTGSVMPPGGSLSDADIQLIQDWIADGALNH